MQLRSPGHHNRRWLILAVIGIAQLMVVLDVTIVNIASAGIFGVLLFLTFYLQDTKGLTPPETGLAFLPMGFSIAPTVVVVSTRLLPRTGPRPIVPVV